MIFIPSCDNREDAIRSLSEIYSISTKKIEALLQNSTAQEIAERYSEIKTDSFHFVVHFLLGASPKSEITHAYFYHATSYDGSNSWFDEGLLGSAQGVKHFLEKISEWLPSDKHMAAEEAALEIVALRSEYESSTAEACGPYAWNTFAAAKSSSYMVPEAIQDLHTGSMLIGGRSIDLSEIIKKRLKPVVVKFKGKISNIDDYCATLWAYLLSDDGECHLLHSFTGNGQAIPKEDILELMDVP